MLEVLETNEVHTVIYGLNDSERGYTKKRLEYRYYDRDEKSIIAYSTDITDIYFEEEAQKQTLKNALDYARTDFLTGIYNRQGLRESTLEMFRAVKEPFAMLLIDLDNFKVINDKLGRITGDAFLCDVAHALTNAVRSEDLVGRIGGDEFLAYLRHTADAKAAKTVGERICENIRQIVQPLALTVSASIGVAMFPRDGQTYEALFEQADNRMYCAKTSGKNQVCISCDEKSHDAKPQPHSTFVWDKLGDIKSGRADLGEEVPVSVYRLLEFTVNDVLNEEFGKERADDIFRKAGFKAGSELTNNVLNVQTDLVQFTQNLKGLMLELKIGVLQIEEISPDAKKLVLTVSQDLDCSGLAPSDEVVCVYDEGFIAGVLHAYTKINYNVREVDCWSNGAQTCRFICSANS